MHTSQVYGLSNCRNAFRILLSCISLTVAAQAQIPGRNINMVSGVQWPGGDPFLQRQNEPSIAVSTRNPQHLMAGANDYRTVDLPGLPGGETGDAWLGVFKSLDDGQTWNSTLVAGYPQDNSVTPLTSPLKGFQAAADPVVRAGTNGMFYYAGLAFNRGSNALSAIVVSRFLDNNNNEAADPIQFLSTSAVDFGTTQVFLDKPWIAVDIPRAGALTCVVGGGSSPIQSFPGGNVYVVYTAFVGDELHGKIMFSRSQDCGATWSAPKQIAPSTSTNQAPTIAINPANGAIYVAWRRFASASDIDAIMFSKSVDAGQTFTGPAVASLISPFDQATSSVSFRTNAYPSMTVDGSGLIYLVWAQRGVGPSGDARVVISTSTSGSTWTAPVPVDNPATRGHQIMPAISFTAGELVVVYYDLRDDTTTGIYSPLGGGSFIETRAPLGDLASVPPHPEKVFTTDVMDASPSPSLGSLLRRHTIDVRVAQAAAGSLNFTSTKVSQYPIGSRPNSSIVEQMQVNPPNLPMFAMGTVPFMGDYLDLAALAFVRDSNGNWAFNTAPSNSTIFHAVWTDNRDVRPPSDGNWANYTPPHSGASQPTSIFDPTQPQAPCQLGQSGARNQNIYTSRITQGLVALSPGNSKPLNLQIPRAFVVSLQNTTSIAKTFRMTIANQPPGGRASFSQARTTTSTSLRLDITIPPLSSAARTVFVLSSVAQAQVRVDIVEVGAPNGSVVVNGLQSSVLLNPDPTNPANPDISNAEVYNPDISNPDISNPDISNPDISNPDISNPDISNIVVENPDISNPDISNPDISNPDISNPDISNPDISNPDISNGAVNDVTWVITNRGNTYSAYTVRTILANQFPTGFKQQLVIARIYTTPVSNGCTLAIQTTTDLLTNITSPVFSTAASVANPDISNPAIGNATVALAPNETARITLRVVNPDRNTNTNFNPAAAVITAATSHAVDTTDLVLGGIQPPVAASQLLIVTNALPSGQAGTAYIASFLSAGGTSPITWSLSAGNTLPPGLLLAPGGTINGTPTTSGTFTFTVIATDSSLAAQRASQNFSIVIAAPKALAITSPSVPSGYVGVSYSYALAASGGSGNRNWIVSAGSLPAGLSLNAAGVIGGVPQGLGSAVFTVMVTDSTLPVPLTASRQYTLQVVPFTMVFTVPPVGSHAGQPIPVQVKVQDAFGNGIPGVNVTLALASGGAPVFNLVNDYSNNSNPNGSWRYGTVSDITGAGFTALTQSVSNCTAPVGDAGGECWTNGQSFPNTASIVHNLTPNPLHYFGTILQPANVLNLWVENTFPAVRWVAPANDTYTVAGLFSRIDTASNPTNIRIVQNSTTTLFSSDLFNDPFAPQTFSLPGVNLTAGATIDFYAGPSFVSSDAATGLAVTITGTGTVLNGQTTVITGTNGVAVFGNVSIPNTGTYQLKASQPATSTIVSSSFTIVP